jgi:GNAT superfamily N-acetyltransferase
VTEKEHEHEIVGRSDVTLELDENEFAYAGKFRVPGGKAVTRSEDGSIVAALSFSPDRAEDEAVRVRYITVRSDLRGEGVGSDLLEHAADCLLGRYEAVRISVNNPFSYGAARKAGFVWTGEETGLAELVMEKTRPLDGDEAAERHEGALRLLRERDLSDDEEEYLREKLDELKKRR